MHDEITIRLEGLEELFDAHGHDIRIQSLQVDDVGVSVLRCHKCGDMVEVHTQVRNSWFLSSESLYLRCKEIDNEEV